MHAASDTKTPRVIKAKNAFVVIIAAVFLAVTITTVIANNKRTELNAAVRDECLNNMLTEMNAIQRHLEGALMHNSRESIRSMGLGYQRLDTMYADTMFQLFRARVGMIEWQVIASILVGTHPSTTLFNTFDGSLTEKEIRFLTQLSEQNKEFLVKIAHDSSLKNIRAMNDEAFGNIICDHQLSLQQFLLPIVD